MTGGKRRFGRGIFRQQQGSIAVEMAIIIPVFLLLVFGIVDFGHAWYMKHVMSDASWEGARYGTRYTGKVPQNLSPAPDIKTHVLVTCGYGDLLRDSSPDVKPTGAAMDIILADIVKLAGKELVVTVEATKTWWVLGYIPGFDSSIRLKVWTTMTCE